jgi:hypothetical protein
MSRSAAGLRWTMLTDYCSRLFVSDPHIELRLGFGQNGGHAA